MTSWIEALTALCVGPDVIPELVCKQLAIQCAADARAVAETRDGSL